MPCVWTIAQVLWVCGNSFLESGADRVSDGCLENVRRHQSLFFCGETCQKCAAPLTNRFRAWVVSQLTVQALEYKGCLMTTQKVRRERGSFVEQEVRRESVLHLIRAWVQESLGLFRHRACL